MTINNYWYLQIMVVHIIVVHFYFWTYLYQARHTNNYGSRIYSVNTVKFFPL